jgi:hypothetical protein
MRNEIIIQNLQINIVFNNIGIRLLPSWRLVSSWIPHTFQLVVLPIVVHSLVLDGLCSIENGQSSSLVLQPAYKINQNLLNICINNIRLLQSLYLYICPRATLGSFWSCGKQQCLSNKSMFNFYDSSTTV